LDHLTGDPFYFKEVGVWLILLIALWFVCVILVVLMCFVVMGIIDDIIHGEF